MVTAVLGELERAGVDQLPEAVAADAGYWNEEHMDEVVANKHIPVLVAPDKGSRGTPRKGWTGGRYDWMRTVLGSDHGRERYKKRKQTTEPTFGNTKHNKGVIRFHRRGRIKVRTEWRLTDDDREPHQGSPPPDRHRKGLKQALGGDTLPHPGPATTDATHPSRRPPLDATADAAPGTTRQVCATASVPTGSDAGVDAGGCYAGRATATRACKSPRIGL